MTTPGRTERARGAESGACGLQDQRAARPERPGQARTVAMGAAKLAPHPPRPLPDTLRAAGSPSLPALCAAAGSAPADPAGVHAAVTNWVWPRALRTWNAKGRRCACKPIKTCSSFGRVGVPGCSACGRSVLLLWSPMPRISSGARSCGGATVAPETPTANGSASALCA